ncbi:MAG TPA: hypothetical protein ENI62_11790 [Gammaproteobacteria bacterium]|nr:hypothetical protein [Gammaproteobacteria bacterium]
MKKTKGSSSEVDRLRSKISSMEENLLSRDLENKDLRERVTLLEQQVQNAKRLIEIRNQQLARIQNKQSPTSNATPGLAIENKAIENKDGATSSTPARPSVALTTSTTASVQPGVTSPDQAATARQALADNAVVKAKVLSKKQPATLKARPEVKKQPPVKPPSRPWWQLIYESVTTNLTSLYGLGGGVVLLGGALLALLRKRRKTTAEKVEDSSQPVFSDAGKEATNELEVGGSDSSFLSDFGLSGMGMMQAAEVDPLAEAEVYMAYGRDEQAEEVLREAMTRDPSRSEIKLKLLDIYEQRGDVAHFETLAQELSPLHSGYDQDVWSKVVEMGQRLSPDSPLFAVVTAARDKTDAEPKTAAVEQQETAVTTQLDSTRATADNYENPFAELDPELGAVEFEAPDTDKLSALMGSPDEALSLDRMDSPSLDFPDLDLGPVEESTAEPVAEVPSDHTLDFDFEGLDLSMDDSGSPSVTDEVVLDAATLEAEQKAAGEDDDFNLLDFDLSGVADEPAAVASISSAVPPQAGQEDGTDSGTGNFDFADFDQPSDRDLTATTEPDDTVSPDVDDFSTTADQLAEVQELDPDAIEFTATGDTLGPGVTEPSGDAGDPQSKPETIEPVADDLGGLESRSEVPEFAVVEGTPDKEKLLRPGAGGADTAESLDAPVVDLTSGVVNPPAYTAADPGAESAAPGTAAATDETDSFGDDLDELDQLIAQDFDTGEQGEQDDWSVDAPASEVLGSQTGVLGVAEDEAATKLDLARAYIDMGDEEGAQGILAEVLEEGNSGQRSQAQSLIGELAG